MKELATLANSANVGDQRDKLQGEFHELSSEIDRIVSTSTYQGTALLDGTFGVKVDTDVTKSTLLAAGTGVYNVSVSGLPKNATVSFDDSTTAGTIVATYDDGAGHVTTQSLTTGSSRSTSTRSASRSRWTPPTTTPRRPSRATSRRRTRRRPRSSRSAPAPTTAPTT
jgi:flagellin-like hook-associated protein FlgL